MPGIVEGVPEARHRVQAAMRAWGEPKDRIDTAALLVTELVANAVQHTDSHRIWCEVLHSADGVRIGVWNCGTRCLPAPCPSPDLTAASSGPDEVPLDESGRGLMLVEALAERWGTGTNPAGRLVWADV
ncbi:ATP-binding protein [Streptomyces sp. AM 4-1-1]|nr:ATP-binding protein [Streptomyces sp. AM 4-1-1]WEH37716.1 ATP-binding protein [Streptomyces sp. AM 4-1-1]